MGTFCAIVSLLAVGYALLKQYLLRSNAATFIELDAGGSFNQAVVGEASYQGELRQIAGAGEVRHACIAVLVKEDDNKFDSNAIAIYIDSHKVGYLSKLDAKRYRAAAAPKGHVHVTCPAVVIGGGRGRENLGVWLDIAF